MSWSLYKRGHTWWLRGLIAGRYVRLSLRTTDRQVAWQRAQRLEREEWTPTVLWEAFQKEFFLWIEPTLQPSTRRKYCFVIARFGRFLKEQGIGDLRGITPAVLATYKEARQLDIHPNRKIPVGPAGIRSDMRILRRFFAYALRCGYLRENPVFEPRLNLTESPTQPFTRDDIQRMLSHPLLREKPELRAVLLMFLFTGLRISDVTHFPAAAVDLTASELAVRTRKTREQLRIPLHPDLAAALRSHLAALTPLQCDSGLLFPTRKGNPDFSLDAKLRRFWNLCGVLNAHAHRFRDTFAVWLLEQGATLYDVAKLLGNSIAVAERHYAPYVRELRERNRRFVESLDSYTDGTVKTQATQKEEVTHDSTE